MRWAERAVFRATALVKRRAMALLGRQNYAFYVRPWLVDIPFNSLRMLAELGQFWPIKPLLVDLPVSAGSVLVFAPHEDDEIIGAGGTLIKHVENAQKVKTIFLTDGAFEEVVRGRRMDPVTMAATREREALLVAEALGASPPVFLKFPNQNEEIVKSFDAIAQTIERILEAERPKLVYFPFFLDAQEQHQLLNIPFARAVAMAGQPLTVCAYPVWSLLPGNVAVDITAELPKKSALLALYSSQFASSDFINRTEGFNRYMTTFVGVSRIGVGAVELFLKLPAKDYAEIVLRHEDAIVAGAAGQARGSRA